MKSTISLLILVLFLNIAYSAGAAEGNCIQGNCDNGYGLFVFDDGRVYEGQWKKGLFDGMGRLIFVSGSRYTGEFKNGFMHGLGKINLSDGSEKKCEVVSGAIQVDEPTRRLWLKDTTAEVNEYIVFLKIGDVYRAHRNYEKSLEYYNKSLKVNPEFPEAMNKRDEVKQKIAELEAKARAEEPPKIVLQGSARAGGTNKVYGSTGISSPKAKSSGTATMNRENQLPMERINRLKKAAVGSGHHLSPGPVISPNTYR